MINRIKGFLKRYKYRNQLRSLIDRYLFFLENPKETIWGSITEEDEDGIARAVELAVGVDGPIVEIGALFGHTTQLLATLKEKNKKLIAVENFTWNPFSISSHDHRLITYRTLRYCLKNCNTEIFDRSNKEFYESTHSEVPSMIFIDAGHTYEEVKYDIEQALKIGIPIISGHDYNDLHLGVKQAVDEFFLGKIEVIGSVWIYKK